MKCVNCKQEIKLVVRRWYVRSLIEKSMDSADINIAAVCAKGFKLCEHEPEPTEAAEEPHVCNEKCSKVAVECPIVTEVAPLHVCGLEGYGHPGDPPCPACEAGRKKAEREAVVGEQPWHSSIPDGHNFKAEPPKFPDGTFMGVHWCPGLAKIVGYPSIVCSMHKLNSGEVDYVAAASGTESALRAALQKIADHDGECGCDHTDADCCEKVGEFCPHCIAEIALQAQPSSLHTSGAGKGIK